MRQVLLNFLRPTAETEPLFADFISQLVNDRLHLKTYAANQTILDENEKMDSVDVILEGHVINFDEFGDSDDSESNVYILYPNEILGLECIRPIDISIHHDLDFKFDTQPIVLKQKFNAAPMPVEKTEIMSIYFDDIETIYRRVREKEHMN